MCTVALGPVCIWMAKCDCAGCVRLCVCSHLLRRRVLATDMKQHVAFTSQFSNVHQKTIGLAEMGQQLPPGPPTPLDNNERLLSLQMALKVADLGSTMEGHEVRLGDVVSFFCSGTGTRLCPLVFHTHRPTSSGSRRWRRSSLPRVGGRGTLAQLLRQAWLTRTALLLRLRGSREGAGAAHLVPV